MTERPCLHRDVRRVPFADGNVWSICTDCDRPLGLAVEDDPNTGTLRFLPPTNGRGPDVIHVTHEVIDPQPEAPHPDHA